MNEINHFKKFILYSCDVTADMDHLYVKRIQGGASSSWADGGSSGR
jgi:hypothetical protein